MSGGLGMTYSETTLPDGRTVTLRVSPVLFRMATLPATLALPWPLKWVVKDLVLTTLFRKSERSKRRSRVLSSGTLISQTFCALTH